MPKERRESFKEWVFGWFCLLYGVKMNDEPTYKIDLSKFEPYTYTLNSFSSPKPKWSIEIAPGVFIHTPRGLNWFHRLMQRLILGFKWKKIIDIP